MIVKVLPSVCINENLLLVLVVFFCIACLLLVPHLTFMTKEILQSHTTTHTWETGINIKTQGFRTALELDIQVRRQCHPFQSSEATGKKGTEKFKAQRRAQAAYENFLQDKTSHL